MKTLEIVNESTLNKVDLNTKMPKILNKAGCHSANVQLKLNSQSSILSRAINFHFSQVKRTSPVSIIGILLSVRVAPVAYPGAIKGFADELFIAH